jgi:hypothetical protein
MTNPTGQEPAFPINFMADTDDRGLSKRELIAAMAMQGLLADGPNHSVIFTCSTAVNYADALIAELGKEKV